MLDLAISIDQGIRLYIFRGEPNDDTLFDCIREAWKDPEYDPEVPEVYDLRQMKADHLSSQGIRNLAKLNEEMHRDTKPVRVAFIAADDLGYGLARMSRPYIHDNRGENIRVFRDEESALEWVRGKENSQS